MFISESESCDQSDQEVKMPGVDFQSYLLAASPPGFDIHYAIRSHFDASSDVKTTNRIRVVSGTKSQNKPQTLGFLNQKVHLVTSSSSSSIDLVQGSETVQPTRKNLSDSSLPKITEKQAKKRVSFADDIGQQLEYIKVLTDSPDTPPCFRSDFLSSLRSKSCDDLTGVPPLKLNFAQPASNYVAFRERLEHKYVSLENVILKDYNLMGTIKVKNLAFHKKVQVRYTLDDWKTFTDIAASYVNNHNASLIYDTFSFDMALSELKDSPKSVQFAIMFEVDGTQYWDNNEGDNYEVVSTRRKQEPDSSYNTTDGVVFGLNHSRTSWTQFCSWNNMDNSIPYW